MPSRLLVDVAAVRRLWPRSYRTDAIGTSTKASGQQNYKKAAFLRTSHFLGSLADAFALIRAVERRYGAIREYRFFKDYEVPTKYQTMIQVTFQDTKSYERIPLTSETILVNLPTIIRDRSGGLGLDELEPLLESQNFVNDGGVPAFGSIIERVIEQEQRKDNTTESSIEVKVERSGVEFFSPPPVYPYFSRRNGHEVARNFVHWAGFNELRPIGAGTPVSEGLLFEPSNVDHPQMRLVLRRYCDAMKMPNPFEVQPSSQKTRSLMSRCSLETDKALAWTPLPGHEHVPEDTPMPSDLLPSKETFTVNLSNSVSASTVSEPSTPIQKPAEATATAEQKTASQRIVLSQSESAQAPPQQSYPEGVSSETQESTITTKHKTEDQNVIGRWNKFLGGWS